MRLVELEAFDAFLEVKLVEVVEGHQVPVPAENVHAVVEDVDTLAVSGAWLFTDNEAMALVVDDFLCNLFATGLLVAD